MSKQITVLFTNIRRFNGINADGESGYWCPERGKEYCVTMERIDDQLVYLTLPDEFRLSFLPPGISTNYTVVREGWQADAGLATLVNKLPKLSPPSVPILESALILEIKPVDNFADQTVFRLPRTLNGMLVDRGYCHQEITISIGRPESPDVSDELCGKASLMLVERNGNLRYFCTTFRVDNLTSKKNLTTMHGCASVCASE